MEDFQPHNSITKMGDWGGVVNYGNQAAMIVLFFLKPIVNEARSREHGRPFYEDKVFVRVHPPGERLNIVERPATEQDRKRWPMQWAQYQQNKPQVSEGTPIEMLFPSQPSVAAALQASGVHTVEQCAELSANAIETIGMGAQQWVNEAQRYLQVANRGVKHSEMRKAMDDLERENNSLKNKLKIVTGELHLLREKAEKAVTLDDVQQLIANQGGNGRRAVYPTGKLNQNFDAQSAQIAATHPTRDLAKSKKTSPKRVRARINN